MKKRTKKTTGRWAIPLRDKLKEGAREELLNFIFLRRPLKREIINHFKSPMNKELIFLKYRALIECSGKGTYGYWSATEKGKGFISTAILKKKKTTPYLFW